MAETIHAHESQLRKIFCDDYVFEIPAYQRPYAWTTDEAGTLLEDLLLASDKPGDVAEMPPYFLGSIVLIKRRESPVAKVVDGQQRLTTLTILFGVLRDLFESGEKKRSVNSYILQEGDFSQGTKDRPRLSLRDQDREFFRKNVQTIDSADHEKSGLTDSQSNIIKNQNRLRDILKDEDEIRRDRLFQFMAQRCYLVVVEATDQAAAYRVFSVMNNRGLDLSPTDILKADIIGAIENERRDHYRRTWENLEDFLGRDPFNMLFGHIRMIYRKAKAEKALDEEFRNYVRPLERPIKFIEDELAPMAKAFSRIRERNVGNDHHAAEINRCLKGLHLIDNQDWFPPAIYFLSNANALDEQARRFFHDLDRLAFSMFIRRCDVNERIRRYGTVIRSLQDGSDPCKDGGFDLSDREQIETVERLNGELYPLRKIVRPVLLRLDEYLSDGVASYEHKSISVEHVLPVTLRADSKWIQEFPSEEERLFWVHRLGNLVLLSKMKNSSAQNYDFDEKKTKYFTEKDTTSFALTGQVVQEAEWTPETIKKRQHELIGAFKSLWRLKGLDKDDDLGVVSSPDSGTANDFGKNGPADLLEIVKKRICEIGDDASVKYNQTHIAFRRGSKYFAFAQGRKTLSHIYIYVKVEPAKIDLEENFTRDVSDKGSFVGCPLEITVYDERDLDRAIPLIRKSYEAV